MQNAVAGGFIAEFQQTATLTFILEYFGALVCFSFQEQGGLGQGCGLYGIWGVIGKDDVRYDMVITHTHTHTHNLTTIIMHVDASKIIS